LHFAPPIRRRFAFPGSCRKQPYAPLKIINLITINFTTKSAISQARAPYGRQTFRDKIIGLKNVFSSLAGCNYSVIYSVSLAGCAQSKERR
jgi:hypothetical protein